ncbi:MAG: DUF2156 domain-containing protein [Clostridia bacterium]|nr:DUF2156 domain-containing protein [Clostridia bacterium]
MQATVAKTTKIDFRPFTPEDRALYERFLFAEKGERGCEFSFANLYLWGRQSFACVNGNLLFFSQFDRRSVYPYPLVGEDAKEALDAIIADARARGIPCRITGLTAVAKETVQALYPGQFRFHCDEGSFDYVYDIHDLAELKGKKYHGKRNHISRFRAVYPACEAKPITEEDVPRVKAMVEDWYTDRLKENPNGDYHMERAALDRALRHFGELELEGLFLQNGEDVLAMTLGSRLSNDTLDVHFEKARAGADGAYAAINCEFANYIREKYPDIRFLDREEDMGLEGLRKAKRSYHPHHMVEKCWACLLEDGYEY